MEKAKERKMRFLELAEEVLKNASHPLNYKEMWEKAKTMGLDKRLRSRSKTPEITLTSQLYAHIKVEGRKAKFCVASRQPITFWLKARENELKKDKK